MEHGWRFVRLHKLNRDVRGQALIETAVSLPFLLALAFNIINFGYFFVIAVNLAASPRTGTLYSIFGSQTPSTPGLPEPAGVNTLTKADLTGGVYNGSTTPVQVCTSTHGYDVVSGQHLAQCTRYNSSPTYTVVADPENSLEFILHQVDVTYTFTPLLDQRLFNLILLAPGLPCSGSGGAVSCTFHRKTYMRAMN